MKGILLHSNFLPIQMYENNYFILCSKVVHIQRF